MVQLADGRWHTRNISLNSHRRARAVYQYRCPCGHTAVWYRRSCRCQMCRCKRAVPGGSAMISSDARAHSRTYTLQEMATMWSQRSSACPCPCIAVAHFACGSVRLLRDRLLKIGPTRSRLLQILPAVVPDPWLYNLHLDGHVARISCISTGFKRE